MNTGPKLSYLKLILRLKEERLIKIILMLNEDLIPYEGNEELYDNLAKLHKRFDLDEKINFLVEITFMQSLIRQSNSVKKLKELQKINRQTKVIKPIQNRFLA